MSADKNDTSDENHDINESINLSFHFVKHYFHMLISLQLQIQSDF